MLLTTLQRHHRVIHHLAVMDHADLEDAVRTTCTEVASALDVARVSAWTYDQPRAAIHCRGLWNAGSYSTTPVEIRGDTHPRYFAALRDHRTIAATDAVRDPRTSEFRDGYLLPLGIGAMLDTAIMVGGESIGVLCVEHVGPPREWSEIESQLMTSATALLAIAFSIDAQNSLQQQLRQSQKMEAAGLLAGGIAHDVNNALNVILGEAEFLVDPAQSPEVLDGLNTIRDAARTAAGFTHKLLTFSRRRPLSLQALDLSRVVAGCERLLRGAAGESVKFELRTSPSPLPILADATLLEQILLNLAVNATQAMSPGGALVFTADMAPAGTAPADVTAEHAVAFARVSVSDTGIGMSPALLARIWEPFFTTRELGSGLGLSVVHGAVRQMQGFVTVESTEGKGSTFHLHFPLLSDATATARDSHASHGGSALTGEGRVLLAEDDPGVRRLLAKTLRRAGYDVTETEDGEQALAAFGRASSDFDLLVSDVVMPVLDGPTAYDRMRAVRPSFAALFVSGYAPNPDRLDHLVQAGAMIAHLTKPVSREDLLHTVARLKAANHLAIRSSG